MIATGAVSAPSHDKLSVLPIALMVPLWRSWGRRGAAGCGSCYADVSRSWL